MWLNRFGVFARPICVDMTESNTEIRFRNHKVKPCTYKVNVIILSFVYILLPESTV